VAWPDELVASRHVLDAAPGEAMAAGELACPQLDDASWPGRPGQ
jgi:hypothetical protein